MTTTLRALGYLAVNAITCLLPALYVGAAVLLCACGWVGLFIALPAELVPSLCLYAAFVLTPPLALLVCYLLGRPKRLWEPKRPDAAAPPARRVLGLWGYAGAGKDTAALGLTGIGWTRVSFADKLRAFCYAQNAPVEVTDGDALFADVDAPTLVYRTGAGLTEYQHIVKYARLADLVDVYGWERVKNEVQSVRELLQRTGTDAGRKVLGENVWVDAVMRDLPEGDVVFTDCRFPNEAAAIAAAGGKVVAISRPGVGPRNNHPSETALEDYPMDGHLLNDGDVLAAGFALRREAETLFGAS